MAQLFEPGSIKGMRMHLRNRIVRSATWEGMCAADGRPTLKLARCYADLARRHGLSPAMLALAFVRSRWFVASTIIGARRRRPDHFRLYLREPRRQAATGKNGYPQR